MLDLLYAKPDFATDGRAWPNRGASRFVRADGISWHVQRLGSGPKILLLHGTGAGVHSFRDLLPRLARDFEVLAPDLPGHAFTETPRPERLSLEAMSQGVRALLTATDFEPDLIVGHSAGAAIALRLCLDGLEPAKGVVCLNGALEPFPGSSGQIFPVLARLLFLNPLAVHAFALRAGRPAAVARLIKSTGSELDEAGLAFYATLLSKPGHVAGALGMMARWNLEPLRRELTGFKTPLVLVAAERDLAVPPRVSEAVAREAPHAALTRVPRLGHLAHEENPDLAVELIRAAAGA